MFTTTAPQTTTTTIEQDMAAAEQAATALRAAKKRNVQTRTIGQEDHLTVQVTVGTRIAINCQHGKFVVMKRHGQRFYTWREYATATKVENVVRHVLNIR